MIKKELSAAGLAIMTTLLLAACGGGSTSNSSVSKLGNTDDVAGLVSGFVSATAAFGAGVSESGAKSATAKSGMVPKRATAKASSSQACDSGSITTTDDTSTVYTSDGSTVASNCQTSFDADGSSGTVSINGKASDKCTDSAQTTDACSAFTSRIADGATGNTTLDTAFVSSSGTPENLEIKLKADITSTENASSGATNLSATVSINDKRRQVGGTATFENFRVVFTDSSSTYTETYDGVFGFSGTQSRCALGKVTLRTDSAVVYSGSDNSTIGGQVTLSDSLGQSARINFNSDGSVTVTLGNGQTKTYTQAQLVTIC